MTKLPITLVLLLCFRFSVSAGALESDKQNFDQKDVFHSAVFLKNNAIISDYQNERIQYYTDHDHVNIFFTEHGLVYRVSDLDKKKLKEIRKDKGKEEKGEAEGIPVNISTVSMKWIGANPHPQILTGEKTEGYHTYLKKVDTGFVTIIANGYKTLTYKDIYPGIDVVYSFPDKGGVKYDLILNPGANPGLIKMKYEGAIKKIKKDAEGNVSITTMSGDIIEHTPVCYTDDNQPVASSFSVNDNTLQFDFPNSYDTHKKLIIDPWVTTLTSLPPTNMGLDVDYDFLGNLYVFGAGASNSYDLSNYFQIAKYGPSGTYLWTFGGSVGSTGWNTTDPGIINYPSNFIVDKNTGKTYTGQGYFDVGTTTIRINQSGGYDNFVSTQNSNVQETWCYAYNCLTNAVIGMGGGTTSNLNMGVINTTTGATTPSNITGQGGTSQDIACGTYDSAGSLYVILSTNNTIYKVNSAYNGNTWSASSNFSNFYELGNKPFWCSYPSSNGFNCLAANGQYLFFYDGLNVSAYSLSTGATVGTPTTVAGYTAVYQGGIAVDNCNNVYVGGKGVIKTFSFNGTSFTPGADISLGAGYTSTNVYDVRYNSSNNLLYVTGNGMVGTYIATLSTTCNTTGSYTVSTTHTCTSINVHVSPAASLNPKVFTYVLTDNAGNTISQLNASTDTIYPITGLAAGTYNLQVQWNVNCGGSSVTQTITINCSDTLAISRDTAICTGRSVILTAVASTPGGTYSWSPGGGTTSSITVTPATNTTFTVTYTPPTGPAITGTVTVTILHSPTVSVNDTTICQSSSAVLTATPSTAGGTYSWNPGGATTPSITVSPATTTTYSVTYTLGSCGTGTNTGIVTVSPPPTVSVNKDTVCLGQNATLTATPSRTGGTYSWTPGGATTQSITVSPATTTTYTVTYTILGCSSATATGTVKINPIPTVTASTASICQGQSATLTATPSIAGGTYSWAPGGSTTQSITVSPVTTTTYTVTYTGTCGTPTASGTVNVAPTPTVSVNVDSICLGQNAVLTATPSRTGGTYSWTPGGSTTQSITVSPASNTTYTVTYSIAGCTAATNSSRVNVTAPPTVAVNSTSICQGQNTTLTATPSYAGGTYSWAPGGATTQSITVSPATTTTYTVTYTAACGVATKTGIVTVTPPPIVSANSVNICFSQNATLTATPSYTGGTYSWAPGGATTQTITVSPATTTTYTVTYTAACGTATANGTINVAPTPTVSVNVDSICLGQNAILTATPSRTGGTYSWTPGGATTQSITVSPTSNTTYSVTYSIAGCLAATNSSRVNVTSPPTVAVNSISICQGQNATLTATPSYAGGTYSWAPGGATTQSITVSPATTTTYTVTYTAACGVATNTGIVTVTPPPTVSANSVNICFSQNATLTATPSYTGGTYSWSPGGAVTQSITVSPATTTTYTVTYTAACGTAIDSGIVTVAPTPTVTVNTVTICEGQNATLTATASRNGGTYSWTPGGAATPSITVSPTATTTYTVTYSIPGCLAINNSGDVDVVIPPVVTVDSSTTCLGISATITATPTIPGGTYSWSPGGDVTQSITVSPASTTTYTVTYTIPSSVCAPVTASGLVTIFAPPTLSVNDTLVCLGASAILTVTPSQSGGTYNWSPGGNATQSITVSPATTTTYTVAYTLLNCVPVIDSGTVTIAPLPTASVSVINAICTAANGQEIVQAGSGTLPYSYLWNNPLHTTSSTLAGLTANSNYTVTVTDLHLCSATATAVVGDSITPLPVTDVLSDITCHGLQNGAVSVTVPNCNTCTYQWSNNTTGASISELSAGSYTVTVTDQNGCTSTASYTITDPVAASLSIIPNDSTTIEDSLVVFNPLFGPYPTSSVVSYSWTPSFGLSCTDCAQPTFSSSSGYYNYSLVITYNQGCQVSDTVHVIVVSQHKVYVPNAFTPNGDGVNDVFMVYPRGGVKYLNLSIYNRWGERIYESLDQGKGWDGRYKGQLQEPGVYVYVMAITFDDNYSITEKGSITLIR